MVAAKYNIKMEQGSTFLRTFNITDDEGTVVDLTDYIARMQIRSDVAASSVIVSCSTLANYMNIDGSSGTIVVSIPATVTSTFTNTSGVYDLELESPDGVVTRLLEGNVRLSLNVTR